MRGYYTTTEAAKRLRLSRQRVLQLGEEGKLVGEQDDELKWKWSRESVDELAREREAARQHSTEDRDTRASRDAQRRWELGRAIEADKRRKQEESEERRELARRFVTAVEAIAQELACRNT